MSTILKPDATDIRMSDPGLEHISSTISKLTEEELFKVREMLRTPKQRWWTNHQFIVSALAFLLSLITALASIYANHRRDIHDQQAQLAAAIQTIQDLNLKQVEVHEKYKNTDYEAQAGGLITTQVNITLLTASDLAFELGTNATSAALSTVAQGLYGLGDYSRAQQLLELALNAARSANEESNAARSLAFLKIRHGSRETLKEGEELFLRAANLERKYPALIQLPDALSWLKASAQLQWATALAPLNCDEARKHFSEGVAILNAAGHTLDLEQLRGHVQRQFAAGIAGVRSCQPLPDTRLN